MRILVIDDDADIRKIARLALEKVGGMQFLEAGSGEEGVRIAAQELPEVILLDVMMPVLDGPATLARIRQNQGLQKTPVIFLTAKVMTTELDRLKQLGAAGVLIKPFKAMTLAGDIRAILREREVGNSDRS